MVFLTGGTGLLGIRMLFDLIKSGKSVRALKRKSSPLNYVEMAFDFYDSTEGKKMLNEIEWIEGDVMDVVSIESGMKNCNEVYHAAAVVSFHKRDREQMLETNIQGTANMVNVAIEQNIEKFCHISSIAALGRADNSTSITEKDLWSEDSNPSYYSISKYYSEMEVWRGIEEGLNAVILCPSLIIGAGRPDISSGKIYSEVWKGLKICGPNYNSIIDARTISAAAIELMKKEIWQERFILSAHDLPSKELFNKVANALGKKGPNKTMSPSKIRLVTKVLKLLSKAGIEPKMSYETISGALMDFRYDNSKLSSFIDVQYPSADDSIKYYSKYYLNVFGQ